MYCKLAGAVCVVAAGFCLGMYLALSMQKRVRELRELERTVHILEGEIRYHHAILYEACQNTAYRCGQPFSEWMSSLYEDLYADAYNVDAELKGASEEMDRFICLWDGSLQKLYRISHLTKNDMDLVKAVGRCLGYPDIEAQQQGFQLECEHIHMCMLHAEQELGNKMKLSIILATLGGILLVIMLL